MKIKKGQGVLQQSAPPNAQQTAKKKAKVFARIMELYYGCRKKLIDLIGVKTPVTPISKMKVSTLDLAEGFTSGAKDRLIKINSDPCKVKSNERGHINRFIFEPSSDVKFGPLADITGGLDKKVCYMWLLKLNNNNQPVLRIGYEYSEGKERYGHPTLAKTVADSDYSGLIGGDLYFDKKSNGWTINNHSGRYGFKDRSLLSMQSLKLQELLDMAIWHFQSGGIQIENIVNYSQSFTGVAKQLLKRKT